jgi:adenine-specific DNA-methyltransferase
VEFVTNLGEREAQRLDLQYRLDSKKNQAERNLLGQFATPPALALDIVRYTKYLLESGTLITFLEPAIGTGAFVSALYQLFPQGQVHRAVGYEIDPLYAQAAASLWKDFAVQIHMADFTKADLPPTDGERFNLLLCNPPYVRHHHLSKGEKQRLQRVSAETAGVKASERCGLYCHFLWIAHQWLAPNGLAGWLVPSEFLSVNYGQQVRDYLLNHVTLIRVHCFLPDDVQFSDALVTSTVVWFRKSEPSPEHRVECSYGGTLATPGQVRGVPLSELRRAKKWNMLSIAASTRPFAMQNPEHLPGTATPEWREDHVFLNWRDCAACCPDVVRPHYRVADLFDVKRGLATGANSFFVLTPEHIALHQIPGEFLLPILPSSRDLREDEIQADSDGNPLVEKLLFLLSCSLPENDVEAAYPSLWKYLQRGKEKGIDRTYVCSHRRPWYIQEKRPASLFVCSYMGRQRSATSSPFRFLLNRSKAVATNAYHVLYPKKNLQEVLCRDSCLPGKLWESLKNLPIENLFIEGRTYGGGLHKMEPRELANVLLGELPGVLLEALNDQALSPP